MPSYTAPQKDILFLLKEVLNIDEVLDFQYFKDVDMDLVEPIISEAAKITEQEIQPLNQPGDQQGCSFKDGIVTTPKGFKEAYQAFVDGGWMSLNSSPEFGGQGLPKMLQVALDEMLTSANVSFSLYAVLSQGAAHALQDHGSDLLKDKFLHKLVSGEFTGTMCLTEAHCGTDLGLLRTKATKINDGSYSITGTKIFITSGEHDLTDNIIHMVLARLPDAPKGVKGISMFLVPKFLVHDDGSLGERNGVYCGSIEHKMGIKASSTCVMNFDNAKGYLIGEANKGMQTMFSMMNIERINIGLEGLGLSEVSYQNALAYAKDRLQSRSLTGAKYPDKQADPLLVHPDVRRMLLTMKAYNEGNRALALFAARLVDTSKHHPDAKQRELADNLMAIITPVIKAFFTDTGFECTNLGLQVFGGHGYISEWGMEQFVRDARIAQIYEGANGIQALDLVKRKLVMNEGVFLNQLTEIMSAFITACHDKTELNEFVAPLESYLKTLVDVSYWIINQAQTHPNVVGSSATDYLKLLGLVILGFMWLKIVAVASKKQEQDNFYKGKILTARFYFKKLLPEVNTLKEKIMAGADSLMDMDEDLF